MAASSAFKDFRSLSDNVYIWDPRPIESNQTTDAPVDSIEKSPKTVVLFTWADAHPRNVLKYTEGYSELYPHAKIIVVRAKTMTTFFGGLQSAMKVVTDVVMKEFYNTPSTNRLVQAVEEKIDEPKSKELAAQTKTKDDVVAAAAENSEILVHVFSNSGGLNFEAACAAWNSHLESLNAPPTPLPIKAVVFDSTPGGDSVWSEFPRWSAGIGLGVAKVFPFLPAFIIKTITAAFIAVFMGLPEVLGHETAPIRCRKEVSNPKNISFDTPRLYLYSEADPLISHKEVESHAEAAEKKGYKSVALEKFEGSGHVTHMRKHPEQYWKAIRDFWARGATTKQ